MIIIVGPCAIESEGQILESAAFVAGIKQQYKKHGVKDVRIVFKSCYNKANRRDATSFHGVGLAEGYRLLKLVKDSYGLEVTSDVHTEEEIEKMKDVLDIIQIPQSLSRYTNIIQAAARTGKQVSIKKGTSMSPEDAVKAVDKVRVVGNTLPVILMDRGTSFGYNDLIVDFRSLQKMKRSDIIIAIDGTHSALDRRLAPLILRAGVAAGAEAIFLEAHLDPDKALCDGPCMLDFEDVPEVIGECLTIKGSLDAFREQVKKSKDMYRKLT